MLTKQLTSLIQNFLMQEAAIEDFTVASKGAHQAYNDLINLLTTNIKSKNINTKPGVSEPKINWQSSALLGALYDMFSYLLQNNKPGMFKKIILSLLENGLDINSYVGCNAQATPVLHIATEYSNLEIIKFLIENNADTNVKDYARELPLHIAARKPEKNEAFLFLLEKTDIERSNKDLYTPLYSASEEGQMANADLLIRKGVDINIAGKDGKTTPLMIAIQNGHSSTVALFMTHFSVTLKLPLNDIVKNIKDVFAIAVADGTKKTVEILLNQITNLGVDIKGCALYKDRTPLFIACEQGDKELVELLIKKGADVNEVHTNLRNKTPLSIALEQGHKEIATLLIQNGATFKENKELLHLAAHKGHLEIIQLFIKEGLDPNQPRADAMIPLYLAASAGQVEVVNFLLNFNPSQNDIHFAFTAAIESNRKAVVEVLLSKLKIGEALNFSTLTSLLNRAKTKENAKAICLLLFPFLSPGFIKLTIKPENKVQLVSIFIINELQKQAIQNGNTDLKNWVDNIKSTLLKLYPADLFEQNLQWPLETHEELAKRLASNGSSPTNINENAVSVEPPDLSTINSTNEEGQLDNLISFFSEKTSSEENLLSKHTEGSIYFLTNDFVSKTIAPFMKNLSVDNALIKAMNPYINRLQVIAQKTQLPNANLKLVVRVSVVMAPMTQLYKHLTTGERIKQVAAAILSVAVKPFTENHQAWLKDIAAYYDLKPEDFEEEANSILFHARDTINDLILKLYKQKSLESPTQKIPKLQLAEPAISSVNKERSSLKNSCNTHVAKETKTSKTKPVEEPKTKTVVETEPDFQIDEAMIREKICLDHGEVINKKGNLFHCNFQNPIILKNIFGSYTREFSPLDFVNLVVNKLNSAAQEQLKIEADGNTIILKFDSHVDENTFKKICFKFKKSLYSQLNKEQEDILNRKMIEEEKQRKLAEEKEKQEKSAKEREEKLALEKQKEEEKQAREHERELEIEIRKEKQAEKAKKKLEEFEKKRTDKKTKGTKKEDDGNKKPTAQAEPLPAKEEKAKPTKNEAPKKENTTRPGNVNVNPTGKNQADLKVAQEENYANKFEEQIIALPVNKKFISFCDNNDLLGNAIKDIEYYKANISDKIFESLSEELTKIDFPSSKNTMFFTFVYLSQLHYLFRVTGCLQVLSLPSKKDNAELVVKRVLPDLPDFIQLRHFIMHSSPYLFDLFSNPENKKTDFIFKAIQDINLFLQDRINIMKGSYDAKSLIEAIKNKGPWTKRKDNFLLQLAAQPNNPMEEKKLIQFIHVQFTYLQKAYDVALDLKKWQKYSHASLVHGILLNLLCSIAQSLKDLRDLKPKFYGKLKGFDKKVFDKILKARDAIGHVYQDQDQDEFEKMYVRFEVIQDFEIPTIAQDLITFIDSVKDLIFQGKPAIKEEKDSMNQNKVETNNEPPRPNASKTLPNTTPQRENKNAEVTTNVAKEPAPKSAPVVTEKTATQPRSNPWKTLPATETTTNVAKEPAPKSAPVLSEKTAAQPRPNPWKTLPATETITNIEIDSEPKSLPNLQTNTTTSNPWNKVGSNTSQVENKNVSINQNPPVNTSFNLNSKDFAPVSLGKSSSTFLPAPNANKPQAAKLYLDPSAKEFKPSKPGQQQPKGPNYS